MGERPDLAQTNQNSTVDGTDIYTEGSECHLRHEHDVTKEAFSMSVVPCMSAPSMLLSLQHAHAAFGVQTQQAFFTPVHGAERDP